MARSTIATAGSTLPVFSARLVLDSVEALSIPIQSVECHYRVMRSEADMPRATVRLVSGYDPASRTEFDAMAVMQRIPAKSAARVVYNQGDNSEDRVLFSGYVQAVGPLRTASAYGVTVMLVSWMSDLSATSAYLSGFAASFPDDAVRPANSALAGFGTGVAVGGSPLFAAEMVHTLQVAELWTTFSGMLRRLLDLMPGNTQKYPGYDRLKLYGENGRGAAALARITGACTFKSALMPALQAQAASQLVQLAAYPDVGGGTLLAKILALCEVFGCMLVPGAESAQIVPDGSYARNADNQGVRFASDELVLLSPTVVRNRDVRGCVMLGVAGQSNAGALSTQLNDPIAASYVAGSAEEGADGADGAFIPVRAPAWLALALVPSAVYWTSIGTDGQPGQGRSTRVTPPAPSAGAAQTAEQLARTAARVAAEDWCAYAWARAVTAGATCSFAGPLRFDVGPGTQARLELAAGSGIDLQRGPPWGMCGMVDGVTLTLDAERTEASTTYSVLGLRTEVEDNKMGLVVPPIFSEYLRKAVIAESTPDAYS